MESYLITFKFIRYLENVPTFYVFKVATSGVTQGGDVNLC